MEYYLRDILLSKKNELETLYDRYIPTLREYFILENPIYKKEVEIRRSLIKNIRRNQVNVIAEVKKSSPSRGLINDSINIKKVAALYNEYESFICGISVLTEPLYFNGSLNYIKEVKEVCELPILRKDFLFNEIQVYESFFGGADCILLISSILSSKKLKRLYELACNLGMEVIAEVHNLKDLDRALDINPRIIGINNRDLKSMQVNKNNIFKILEYISKENLTNKTFICESGIGETNIKNDLDYIKELYERGVRNFLIGTYFMQSKDLQATLKETEELFKKLGID